MIDQLDFEKILVIASNNRILKVFVDNLLESKVHLLRAEKKVLSDISLEGDKLLDALGDTIKLLDAVFSKNNIDYLIVKTYKYLDYVTFDVDVLVKYDDFFLAQNALSENGVDITPHPGKNTQGLHQRNCFKKGLLKIDLHRKFYWLGIDHIDDDFLWKNTRKETIGGFICPIPSVEVDFLLHNKQLIFERRYITFLDFIAIKLSIQDKDSRVNWKIIEEMVVNYKWQNGFYKLMAHLNLVNYLLYDETNLFPTKKKLPKLKQLTLPYIYPLSDDLAVFAEIIVKHRKVPFIGLVHYVYSWLRYKVNSRFPFYDHWYRFSKISSNKYSFQKVIN